MDYVEFVTEIGLKIKEIRLGKFPDETYNSIGHKAKMRGSDWEAIEKGKTNPTLKTLFKIAEALDCDIWVFFHRDPVEANQRVSALKRGR